jgi:ComF family protein
MRDLLANLFFGGTCFLCRGACGKHLCEACTAELPHLGAELCPSCALPTPGAAVCGRCLSERPAYDATTAVLAYDFPADALVHALKFRGELALAPFLGKLLAGKIADPGVDRVIAVPLSARRLASRGYNQAVEIARPIARGKLDVDACVREHDGTPQMELAWEERRRNIRGAFRCRERLTGETVAIVDDVMTTGATLDELARTLKRAGAARVVNWVLARTLPPS